MSEIVSVMNALPNHIPLKSAEATEISNAEQQLKLVFADEYKQYLAAFGALLANGIELTGIAKSKHRNVVSVTEQEWEININVPPNMYVVQNVGIEGIIIWQDEKGKIYKTIPHSEPKEIASSLVEYIKSIQ